MIIFTTGIAPHALRYWAIIKYEAFLWPEIKCSVCLESLNVAERATVVSKWIVNSLHFQFRVPLEIFFYRRMIRSGFVMDVSWFIEENVLNFVLLLTINFIETYEQRHLVLFCLSLKGVLLLFPHLNWHIYLKICLRKWVMLMKEMWLMAVLRFHKCILLFRLNINE